MTGGQLQPLHPIKLAVDTAVQRTVHNAAVLWRVEIETSLDHIVEGNLERRRDGDVQT